jgi:hypothetical protein
MTSTSKSGFGSLCCLLVVLLPATARAVPEFPREIQRALALDYDPPCSLCHVKENTGTGTAETPFALSMREQGLIPDDGNALRSALTGLKQAAIDSDGDGVSDTDELIVGTDPNSVAPASLKNRVEPQWGCSALPGSAHVGCIWCGLVALAFALHRGRRGRR